ncbi:asparagine synthase (glutamine-hydrolyzing) [Pelagibacteraceae bacterium]|nr:asparagine synthase (glutamine-hydrolyzing) [Pelagibacteraceae bacterium]
MCGIYGITEKNKNLVLDIIKKCSHRGPDAQDIYLSENLTLGHNLLSITSKPNEGTQPWVSERGNVLIYNGEIFNYNELKYNYKDKFNPRTTCDTELLSWLLDNFGYENVFSNLIDSMHALVWYNKSENEIILSRDHAGIKPLYFGLVKSGLIFCSEIKGLLPHINGSSIIDRQSLACTSLLGVNVLRQTIFKGIYKVFPGETIVYDLYQKKIKRKFRSLVKPYSNKKFNKDEFLHNTSLAINRSTLGIRKFGLFLSGGIDSSVVAYELNKNLKNINSFTNIMDPNEIIDGEDHNSDAYVANNFSKEIGLEHKEVKITPSIISNYWDETINFMEEPRYNWNLPMYYFTNKILSENKIVVTMSGDMGDELYGGYSNYYRMKKLVKQPKNWDDFLKIWMRKFASPIQLNIKFDYNDLHDLLKESLPEELWNPDDIANSAMALDCVTVVSEDFFTRNDKFGMAFSMEGRFPLASKQYMLYCLSMNSDYKFGTNIQQTKMPVRNSYNNILPKYIIEKQKTGWSVPLTIWLNYFENLKNKYIQICSKEDGISPILSKENYKGNPKRMIITWMLRSWAQQYNMSL